MQATATENRSPRRTSARLLSRPRIGVARQLTTSLAGRHLGAIGSPGSMDGYEMNCETNQRGAHRRPVGGTLWLALWLLCGCGSVNPSVGNPGLDAVRKEATTAIDQARCETERARLRPFTVGWDATNLAELGGHITASIVLSPRGVRSRAAAPMPPTGDLHPEDRAGQRPDGEDHQPR